MQGAPSARAASSGYVAGEHTFAILCISWAEPACEDASPMMADDSPMKPNRPLECDVMVRGEGWSPGLSAPFLWDHCGGVSACGCGF
eukprot:6527805-Pyramimonas_sp.AAC.1